MDWHRPKWQAGDQRLSEGTDWSVLVMAIRQTRISYWSYCKARGKIFSLDCSTHYDLCCTTSVRWIFQMSSQQILPDLIRKRTPRLGQFALQITVLAGLECWWWDVSDSSCLEKRWRR
jgi:hypothetical protein